MVSDELGREQKSHAALRALGRAPRVVGGVIGNVLYAVGCAVACVAVLASLWMTFSKQPGHVTSAVFYGVIAIVTWLVGRGIKAALAGR